MLETSSLGASSHTLTSRDWSPGRAKSKSQWSIGLGGLCSKIVTEMELSSAIKELDQKEQRLELNLQVAHCEMTEYQENFVITALDGETHFRVNDLEQTVSSQMAADTNTESEEVVPPSMYDTFKDLLSSLVPRKVC